ncbi:MAG: hypothetical protein KGH83_00750 [Thaumarchaeota archaeon]|nr:hypothetical protein [Nitrososphaerota archaeon]
MKPILFLLFFSISVILLLPMHSYGQTTPKNEIAIKVSFVNDTDQPYAISLNPQETYTLSQSYSWVRDQNSRFNLQSYSMDNGPYQPIDRVSRGNFTLDVPTDTSHSIVFIAVTQYPIEVNGTSGAIFNPTSPTNDNWFDEGSDIKISTPYTIKLGQGYREQLEGWSIDDGSSSQITTQGDDTFTTPLIHVSRPHSIDFIYNPQYYVNVISEFGHIEGAGWYDSGTTATISVKPTQDFPVGHTFEGWQGVENSSNSIDMVVNSPRVFTAVWKTDYSPIVIIGAIIVGSTVGIIIFRKRRRRVSVQSQTESNEKVPEQVEIEPIKTGQIDDAYTKELSAYTFQKSLEKLDTFQASGILSLQRHAKLKEEITQDK